MLIIEIVLTVLAWRKGFKALALLPVGLAFVLAFFIGLSSPDAVDSFPFVILDVFAIIALIVMLAVGSRKPVEPQLQQEPEQPIGQPDYV